MPSRDQVYETMRTTLHRGVDRMFLWLLLGQWVFAVTLAVLIAPSHLQAAVVLGGGFNAISITLILTRPGAVETRHTIAAVQMMWSALLIAITDGRIETHFHLFGSLAFLAAYREWRVLVTATVVVTLGQAYDATHWWQFVEHVAWVLFEDAILIVSCMRATREMRAAAARESRLERNNKAVERHVEQRTLELQESSERYRALVENTEAIAFEYDVISRRMLYIAPQASRLLDCTLSELEDSDLLESFLHPDDRERIHRTLHALQTGARSWSDAIDCRLLTRSGRIVYIRTFLNARAGSRRIRAITLDVTRQHQLEFDLHQSQKLESVGRLAAGVAHEINTPIQFVGDSVQFMAQVIDDVMVVVTKQQAVIGAVLAGVPSSELVDAAEAAMTAADEADLAYIVDELPKAAERALDGVDRVGTIVRSMKVFAHPDNAEMAPVDLNSAIQSTLTIARNEYRYVANVITELGDLPPVNCYVGEINQVILNVIINATHAIADIHTQTGTRGLISVKTAATDDHVLISITDTGGGIPDHAREHIFDPFFTTKDVGKGTGQGLSIARSVIVDRHAGSLTFETTPGKGTTFYIRLPIARQIQTRCAA